MNTFSDTDLDAAETIIGALDSRLRVQIIWRLSVRDHFVHELVDGLEKSQPLISQHLRVLKRSGIVDSERRGREVVYRLVIPEVAQLIDAAVTIGHRALDEREQLATGRREPSPRIVPIAHLNDHRGSTTRQDVTPLA